MQTWFDRLRGMSQGRVSPVLTPPHGSNVFVLGEEQPIETTRLMPGDHTTVAQVIDLTDWDFVKATMDTIGRASGSASTPPGWSDDANELFKFNFDVPVLSSQNLVIPAGFLNGFSFDSIGNITYPQETYSGADTYCRCIQAYTVIPTHLFGVHTPPVVKTPLASIPAYTVQMWVNFDVDSHPASSGVDFELLDFYGEDGANKYGLRISMVGLMGGGSHQWYPRIDHYTGVTTSGVNLNSCYTIDENQGWQMLTFCYDSSAAPNDRIRMYRNSTNLGTAGSAITVIPSIPPEGSTLLQYGDMNCWGQLDSCRLLDRVLTSPQVSTSYTETITSGVTINTNWVQQILIDSKVYASRVIQVGEERRWTDFIAPVRRLVGHHTVEFRMELQEA